jgi:hypothetical protein
MEAETLKDCAPCAPEVDDGSMPCSASLVGCWQIVSNDVEFHSNGRREPMFGAHPQGYLIFTAEGRMMAYVEAQDRTEPASDAEFVRAYRSMCAYSGRFQIEGSKWVTSVDVAWNGVWTGTRQVRHFWLRDGYLHVTSDWYASPLHNGRLTRAHLVWEREAAERST